MQYDRFVRSVSGVLAQPGVAATRLQTRTAVAAVRPDGIGPSTGRLMLDMLTTLAEYGR
jgi:hypothetical protein